MQGRQHGAPIGAYPWVVAARGPKLLPVCNSHLTPLDMGVT